MPSRSLRQLLNDKDRSFRAVRDKARELDSLNQKLQAFLPSPLNKHCTIANLRQDVLVLSVSSPAWSARIRYMTPAILNYLQDKCSLDGLKSLRIKVCLPEIKKLERRIRPAALSKKAAAGLNDFAETLSDEPLRDVMRKLASRASD